MAILENDAIPLLTFHATCDSVVPYYEGPLKFCYEPTEYGQLFGSWNISRRLQNLGNCSQLYTVEGGLHDAIKNDTIVQYGASFIKSILCEDCQSTEFYRLENVNGCAVRNHNTLHLDAFYPNPVGNQINISMVSALDLTFNFKIYNLLGQEVLYRQASHFPPRTDYAINVRNLNAGVYFFEVKGGELSQQKTFLKR
jgi:hypothetical protein